MNILRTEIGFSIKQKKINFVSNMAFWEIVIV